MRPNRKVIGALLTACVPLLVVLTGCGESNVLTPGSGELEFRAELDNASGRFVDNDFDSALIEFSQIEVRPTDPQADASLGGPSLALLAQPLRANFVSGISRLSITPQTSGQYRLVRLLVNRLVMADVDDLTVAGLSDPLNPVCHDFIKSADLRLTEPGENFLAIGENDLGPAVLVRLDAIDPGRLTMRIDYPAYLSAFNASLNCASCACPAAYMPNQIPRTCSISGAVCTVNADCPSGQTCRDCTCPVTVANFDNAVFKSLASSFLSFE